MTQLPTAPPTAVRDSFAVVFEQPAYDRSLRETLWSRLLAWFGEWFERLREAMSASPAAYWTARALLVLVALAVVGRLAYVLWSRFAGGEHARLGRMRAAAGGADPWASAQREAAAGRYTEAAHLLYQAILVVLAGRERLRLHPSKTVGDYARELRARSSSAFPGYREFARAYETVVYGLQHCDRERWERLQALAVAITGPRG